jgi:hypothetical protein
VVVEVVRPRWLPDCRDAGDLAISHDRLGDLAAAAGDAAARTACQAALAIAGRLAAADPANAEWQQAVEFYRQRLADLG